MCFHSIAHRIFFSFSPFVHTKPTTLMGVTVYVLDAFLSLFTKAPDSKKSRAGIFSIADTGEEVSIQF